MIEMPIYTVKHNALIATNKDGVAVKHVRDSEVELDAKLAERLVELGAIELKEPPARGARAPKE